MATAFANQITNRNFLSPAAFQFNITKVPKVSFFCSSASIPSISLETNTQPSYLKDIDVPGEKLNYENLTLRFLVDEDLKNYMAIHNWMTGLGFPESTKDFKDEITKPDTSIDMNQQYSDGSLSIQNSNFRTNAIVKFKDLFPISLTSLEFDTGVTDIQYFTAEASFKYLVYNIVAADGRTRL
mgnify:FL=1|tara:strand:+ start:194 stop:742 length:549 start_codon:yes stop_codon:yes gene_type:complete